MLELRASGNGLAAASALANPTITFTPGFTRAGSDEELLLQQPLELNGTRSARAGIARARMMASRAQIELELREFIYSIKSAYIDLAKTQERLLLTKAIVASATELESIASRQVELGSRAGVERTQTAIEAKRAKQQATLAQAEYQSAQTALNVLIGQDITTPLSVSLSYARSQRTPDADLIALATASRSELRVSTARQDEFRQESRLANASLLPDIVPQYRMESLTRSPRDGGFGISISLPLLDHGRVRNEARQADTLRKAEELRMKALQEQIRAEVTQALARLKAAEEVLSSYDDGLFSDSKKLLDATRSGYALGETSLATVLEAQRTFRSVQAEQIDALASYSQAAAELERAIGAVSPELLKQLTFSEASGK